MSGTWVGGWAGRWRGVTYQVDEAGGGEPDADEDAGELRQADAVAGAQQAQVLQDVGE